MTTLALLAALVPLATSVAVAPVPAAATLGALRRARPWTTAGAYAAAWTLGIAAALAVSAVVVGVATLGGAREGDVIRRLVLGVLLVGAVILAGQQWHVSLAAHDPGEARVRPGVRSAVRDALAQALLDPKSLVPVAAAGTLVGTADVSAGQAGLAVGAFTLVGALPVLVPLGARLVAGRTVERGADEWRAWLAAHGRAVSVGVLLLLAGVLAGELLGHG